MKGNGESNSQGSKAAQVSPQQTACGGGIGPLYPYPPLAFLLSGRRMEPRSIPLTRTCL